MFRHIFSNPSSNSLFFEFKYVATASIRMNTMLKHKLNDLLIFQHFGIFCFFEGFHLLVWFFLFEIRVDGGLENIANHHEHN